MDDTPGRVKRPNDDLSGRANPADEPIGLTNDERARNYAGSVAEPAPDTMTSEPGGRVAPGTLANAANAAAASVGAPRPATDEDEDEDEDVSRRTRQIRGEIEQTRGEMTETIDAIQEKLRPSNIVANATDRVKQATTEGVRSMADMASGTANEMMDYGRDAYGAVAGEVRQNPLPLAMIGIGAAWLLMGRSSGSGRGGPQRPSGWNPRSGYAGGPAEAPEAPEALWRRPTRIQADSGVMSALTNNPIPTAMAAMGLAWLAFSHRDDVAGGWDDTPSRSPNDERWRQQYQEAQRRGVGYTGTNTGSGAPGAAAETTQGAVDSLKESAQGVASAAQDYAGDAMQSVQRRGRQAQNELERMLNDNPLVVGAGALALGAVIGMALPETQHENEWMGDARDQVVDRAQQMARDAASKVQETAGEMAGELTSRVGSGDTSS